jgi:hypothetical protein
LEIQVDSEKRLTQIAANAGSMTYQIINTDTAEQIYSPYWNPRFGGATACIGELMRADDCPYDEDEGDPPVAVITASDKNGMLLLNDATQTSADCGTNQMQNLLQMGCGTI